MTKEEFADILKEINDDEAYAEAQTSEWGKEVHRLHEERRKTYKEYVTTSGKFPFKEGQWYMYEEMHINKLCEYKVTGKLRLKEISTYLCDLSKIILTFENLVGETLRFDYVTINGVFKYNPTVKFTEIEDPTIENN